MQNSARLLGHFVGTGQHDRTLTPILQQIEKRAVRSAANKVIDRHGRINHANRFANDLVPGLTDLAVLELLRLKLTRFCKTLVDLLNRQ